MLSPDNTELLAKIILAAMSLVGTLTFVYGLWMQNQSHDILADDSSKDDFDMSITILTAVGMSLLAVSIIVIFFVYNGSIERLLDNNNYSVYLVLCAFIGIAIIVASQSIVSQIDKEKEKTLVDGFKPSALMNMNIVLGVICLLAALVMLVAVNNSSKVGDSAFIVSGDDFGFDFEF